MKKNTSFRFWDFNIWQNISSTGLVVSGMAHLGLHFTGRQVADFNNLYFVWAAVFAAGTLLRYYQFRNGIEPGHHHHHHD
jgi:hypothetical protein